MCTSQHPPKSVHSTHYFLCFIVSVEHFDITVRQQFILILDDNNNWLAYCATTNTNKKRSPERPKHTLAQARTNEQHKVVSERSEWKKWQPEQLKPTERQSTRESQLKTEKLKKTVEPTEKETKTVRVDKVEALPKECAQSMVMTWQRIPFTSISSHARMNALYNAPSFCLSFSIFNSTVAIWRTAGATRGKREKNLECFCRCCLQMAINVDQGATSDGMALSNAPNRKLWQRQRKRDYLFNEPRLCL